MYREDNFITMNQSVQLLWINADILNSGWQMIDIYCSAFRTSFSCFHSHISSIVRIVVFCNSKDSCILQWMKLLVCIQGNPMDKVQDHDLQYLLGVTFIAHGLAYPESRTDGFSVLRVGTGL